MAHFPTMRRREPEYEADGFGAIGLLVVIIIAMAAFAFEASNKPPARGRVVLLDETLTRHLTDPIQTSSVPDGAIALPANGPVPIKRP